MQAIRTGLLVCFAIFLAGLCSFGSRSLASIARRDDHLCLHFVAPFGCSHFGGWAEWRGSPCRAPFPARLGARGKLAMITYGVSCDPLVCCECAQH